MVLYRGMLCIQHITSSSSKTLTSADCWSMFNKQIDQADYKFPHWLTESQKQLIPGILDPSPIRVQIQNILCIYKLKLTNLIISSLNTTANCNLGITEDTWSQTDYKPSCRYECDEKIYLDDVNAAFESMEVRALGSSKIQCFITSYFKVYVGKWCSVKDNQITKFYQCFSIDCNSHDLDLSGLFEGRASK